MQGLAVRPASFSSAQPVGAVEYGNLPFRDTADAPLQAAYEAMSQP